MAVRQQQRRGTASQWTSANPILSAAEIGYETDTNKFKIGDGTNRWATLSYFVDLDTMIAGAPGLLNSLDEIAAAINDDPTFFTTISTGLATKAPLASPTFTGTVSGITKSMVGLGSVDNTADSAKPVSTATQTALNGKENILTSAEFTNKAITAVSGSSYGLVGTSEYLDVKETNGYNKEIELDIAAVESKLVIDGFAKLASPTFTGTVSGVTKSMVGLGSVDNTADSAKPVSTATQTALDSKAPLASPALTGNPTAPTQTVGNDSTKIATTAFVKAAIQDITSLGLVLDGGGV